MSGYSIGWGPRTIALMRRRGCDQMAEAFAMARGARAQTATPERRAEIEARVAELQAGRP